MKRNVNPEFYTDAKIFFKNEDKILKFSGEQKVRDLVTSRPVLREMIQDLLQGEGKSYQKETWNFRNK